MKLKNILVSQPMPQVMEKSPFNELITNHKVKIDFTPFIKVEPASAKEFRSQRVDVLSYSAIIFSSKSNIDNFFKICEENRVVVSEEMKYFCTTETIALYLQKYIVYRKRKIFYGKGSFADLMTIILKHKEEKYLFAVTEPYNADIVKLLEKSKIKFEKIVLAHTVSSPLKDSVDISKYDILVFYSPSEVKSLIDNFEGKIDAKTKIATFGTGTAKAAVEAGLEVSILAPTPTFPSMIMALNDFIKKSEKGQEIDLSYIKSALEEAKCKKESLASKAKPVKKKVATKTSCATTTTTTRRVKAE